MTRSLGAAGLLGLSACSACALLLGGGSSACSDSAGTKPTTTPTGVDGGVEAGPDTLASTEQLRVSVAGARVYVKLASPPAIVAPADPKTDRGWDLAFEGLDVLTNSGPSGGGSCAAFGPLETIVFLDSVAPTVPFLAPDTTGGAFSRWWFYGGAAANHALYSRYHNYGIQDGAKQYKVQVLNYYGVRDGAPTSALYRVRWSEVTAAGPGPTKDIADLDGTAGGTQGGADAKSECLDLGTSVRTMLTPAEARASSAWHLCFRRQDINVNGEIGGPRGVGAIDLDAAKTSTEKLTDILNKSNESEQPAFDAVNAGALAGQTYRGDRIVSAFGALWLERDVSPPTPSKTGWLVVGADGKSKYLVGFGSFEGATATSPGTIVMGVKAVQ